ncbi:MAG: hypothetical protein KI791_10755 [Cyclobacteriaceae bacterium]|nr:hypothetical protein [Cyclobacteriaceae bacterium SS2]
MKLTKILNIIWLINGFFFLIGLPILMWKIIEPNRYAEYDNTHESLIIGDALDEAKKKGMVIQTVDYDKPQEVTNSPYFMLPIYAKTYESPLDLGMIEDDFEDIMFIPPTEQPGPGTDGKSKIVRNFSYYSSNRHVVNILFLNYNYEVIRTLLVEKAFISSFRIPEQDYWIKSNGIVSKDTTIKNITFQIAFEDTNNDGKLDDNDNNDLYISDLDGDNFKKVTEGIDIINYHFMKNNSELLIEFHNRSEKKEEYKRKLFATYTIPTETLSMLSEVHERLQKIDESIRD